MKYLVVIQLSSGRSNATIFSTVAEAKEHLSEIASDLKYPIQVKWEDDECISAKITQSDWIRVQIIKPNGLSIGLSAMLVAKKMKNAGSPFVKMRLILQRITTPRHLLSKNVSENGLRIQIIIILLNFMQLYLNPKMGAVK